MWFAEADVSVHWVENRTGYCLLGDQLLNIRTLISFPTDKSLLLINVDRTLFY